MLINGMTLEELRDQGYFKSGTGIQETTCNADNGTPCPYACSADNSDNWNVTVTVTGEWVVGNDSDSCTYTFSCDNAELLPGDPPYDRVTDIYVLKECQAIPSPQCFEPVTSTITSTYTTTSTVTSATISTVVIEIESCSIYPTIYPSTSYESCECTCGTPSFHIVTTTILPTTTSTTVHVITQECTSSTPYSIATQTTEGLY